MTAGIVARWTTHPDTETNASVGMLAAVVDTPAGARLVIAQRTPAGDWVATRAIAATADAVRMVRRQNTPAGVAGAGVRGGGLW